MLRFFGNTDGGQTLDLLVNVLKIPKCSIDKALKQTHDVELLNKIQDVSADLLTGWDHGIPKFTEKELNETQAARLVLLNAMLVEYNDRMAKDEPHRLHLAEGSLVVEAMKMKRFNEKTHRKEWALMSKSKDKSGKHKVLKWFGLKEPSDEDIAKEEKRIQYFKYLKKAASCTGIS